MDFKKLFNSVFGYTPPVEYNFDLPSESQIQHDLDSENPDEKQPVKIYPSLSVNIEYLRTKYNLLINSDESNITAFYYILMEWLILLC